MREAAAGEQGGPARKLRTPTLHSGIGLRAHQLGAAVPERHEVVQAEGENVERMLVQDLLPNPERGIEVPCNPLLQRSDVCTLAAGGRGAEAARGVESIACGRHIGASKAQHLEIAFEHMPKAEFRVRGEQGTETLGRVRPVLQVTQYCVIERARGLR